MDVFDQMKKRDWAFLAACLATALLFGIWSVQMGIAHHRVRRDPTDLSSANKRGGDGASVTAPASPRTGDANAQTRHAR
ncbi:MULTISPECIES: hypothetical protein [unclassified Bradyrhizobium]|uniref:hypothetical protein n=1 Tax=unclassified Bradyrhizobium TaxID=2631580 RepID=UPI002479D75B|nr:MULTISPECIES: hypothetical protein [unclassified Bradyrhizobium]WGS17262.1 hypothetical protein MTX22_21530 [Bradyrhizobium sp. ISRA463]WGS30998.1 hypothetical protein MTX19_19215 [Bradyrhizobium sp. ISRA464]